MTSEKYFHKWVREAGRGHIAAFLSWGCLLTYGMITAVQLRFKSDYSFFGIGSGELLWICAGLGAVLSFLEFFYLLQPKKLDFYYSLPVRKSTIFWGRYVHGLMHFLIPLCLVVTGCGLYESSFDMDFFPFSAGYTGRSILVFAGIFLIFYHIGILLLTVCGTVLPAILGYALCLLYGHILVGNVWAAWAADYFRTYYRIPVFEKLDILTAPLSLARDLAGSNLFDKWEVFGYVPSGSSILAATEWIVLPFLLFAAAQKRRRTERVGKWFAIPMAERAAEGLLSFLAGVWMGSFLAALTGLAMKSPGLCGALSILAGIAAAAAVHFLLELGVGCGWKMRADEATINEATINGAMINGTLAERGDSGMVHRAGGKHCGTCALHRGIFRRKWQLAAECAAVIASGLVFLLGASAFDAFLPKEGEVEKIGVSIGGIGMNNESYTQTRTGGERYETPQQLERYLLAGEGKSAAAAWIKLLVEKNNCPDSGTEITGNENSAEGGLSDRGTASEVQPEVTHAVICCHMKNGREVYRFYSVDEELLQAFAAVFETDEYKQIAYPVDNSGFAVDARFTWSDGVTDTVMKLEESEKEALLDACQKDIRDMKMDDLRKALPLGFVELVSDGPMLPGSIPVYPFFARTCSLLEAYGVQTGRTLSDYSVRSVSVSTRNENGRGKRSSEYLDDPEEIAKWMQKAVPKEFDLQPLFYPLDYSKEIRVEVLDETANSVIHVNCYSQEE